MTEERVLIEIDDSQLDAVLMKLDLLETKASGVIGGGGRGGKKLDTALPGINRELRLILGKIPGMREAMQYYFRIKRLERGMVLGGAQFYLTIIATALVLIKELQEQQRRAERRKMELEMMIRKYRGFTHEEYEKEMERWKLYSRGLPP